MSTNHPNTRERVLARLWQIADLSPEATRNNINGQLKALTMIVAIEGLIPNKFNTQPAKAAEPKHISAVEPTPQPKPSHPETKSVPVSSDFPVQSSEAAAVVSGRL